KAAFASSTRPSLEVRTIGTGAVAKTRPKPELGGGSPPQRQAASSVGALRAARACVPSQVLSGVAARSTGSIGAPILRVSSRRVMARLPRKGAQVRVHSRNRVAACEEGERDALAAAAEPLEGLG